MAERMGFEGILYYGVAGSTAATQLTNCRDITVEEDHERGDTTVRGDSSAPPIGTEAVTKRMLSIEFVMLNDSSDTSLEALRVASAAGAAVALRGKDHSAGKGPDADFTVTVSKPWPLNGEQVVTFKGVPTRGSGRAPQIYV